MRCVVSNLFAAAGLFTGLVQNAGAQALQAREIPNGGTAIAVAGPPGNTSRAFVATRTGTIRVLDLATDTFLPTPFASFTVTTTGEGGFLGLAFDPNYTANGHFYVYYTDGSQRRIVRGTRSAANPDVSDPALNTTILQFNISSEVHIGGWLGFGPDGYLYIASGEGGGNAQSTATLYGKILRVDVRSDGFPHDATRNYAIPADNPFASTPGAAPEIWVYGLRNPFRCCFDWSSGALVIADVGQSNWEEINLVTPTLAGSNLGWPCFEGPSEFSCDEPPETHLLPIATYRHGNTTPPFNVTGVAIVGGVVYRGSAIPSLTGRYVFADYLGGWLLSTRLTSSGAADVRRHTCDAAGQGFTTLGMVFSLGEDGRGEVYVCRSNRLYRLEPNYADCNGNGVSNACDIAAGTSIDADHDGIPDECRCRSDWNDDESVNPIDIAAFVTSWINSLSSGSLAADFNRNGAIEPADIASFVTTWLADLSDGC